MVIQSDKWQHSFQRYFGLHPDTSFRFGVIPGFCRESVGRRDWVYTSTKVYNTQQLYCWSDFHHKRLCKEGHFITSYYGTAPFLWDLDHQQEEDGGTLFFLPNDDLSTIRDADYKIVQDAIDSAPEPITFLLPWRKDQVWKHWEDLSIPGHADMISLSDRVNRQLILTKLFQQKEYIYLAYPGTDLYYASFLDKEIVIYDSIKNYRSKTDDELAAQGMRREQILSHLIWGYDYLNDVQKEYFHWTENWNDIELQDRQFLTQKILGLDALKSPADLFRDMKENNLLYNEKFVENEKYNITYEWLKSKVKKITPTDEGLEKYAKM